MKDSTIFKCIAGAFVILISYYAACTYHGQNSETTGTQVAQTSTETGNKVIKDNSRNPVIRNIENANYEKKYFHIPNFKHSKITDTNFKKADFHIPNFEHSKITNTDFKKAHFHHGNFVHSTFANVDFEKAELNWAHFEHTEINDVDFKKADFHSGTFANATLNNVDFRGTTLNRVNFCGTAFGNIRFDLSTDIRRSRFEKEMKPVLVDAGLDIERVRWCN